MSVIVAVSVAMAVVVAVTMSCLFQQLLMEAPFDWSQAGHTSRCDGDCSTTPSLIERKISSLAEKKRAFCDTH